MGKKEKHLLQTRRALEAMSGFKAHLQMQTSKATG
jgi:hypothetical protein